MLLDLVSPWAAAVGRSDPASRHAFQTEHATLLTDLQRQRTAGDAPRDPVADPVLLGALASLTSGRATQRMLQLIDRTRALGADLPSTMVLLAGDGRGDPMEVLPWQTPPIVAVYVELMGGGLQGVRRMHATMSRGLALATRWGAADSESVLATPGRSWDRWAAARDVPLSEWIYSDGVASHLACAANPDTPVHAVLGVTKSEFATLRQQERVLRQRLAPALGESGVGGVLRWLNHGGSVPVGARPANPVPHGAGRYLAWRMTAERVRSIGLPLSLRRAS